MTGQRWLVTGGGLRSPIVVTNEPDLGSYRSLGYAIEGPLATEADAPTAAEQVDRLDVLGHWLEGDEAWDAIGTGIGNAGYDPSGNLIGAIQRALVGAAPEQPRGAVDLLREARAFLDTRHGSDGKLRRPADLIEQIDTVIGGQ